jgi:hypothetical protein
MPTSRSACTFIIDALPLDKTSTHANKQVAMHSHHRRFCQSAHRRRMPTSGSTCTFIIDSRRLLYWSPKRRRMPTSRSPCTLIIDALPLDETSTHADKQIDMQIHHRCSQSTKRRRMLTKRSTCTFIIDSRRFVTDVLLVDEPSTHADKQIAMQIHHRCST